MKRLYVVFLFSVVIVSLIYAKDIVKKRSVGNENAIWYFGNRAGLDFTSGTPIALTDGQQNTVEGCATVSDSNGQLLFYTDGVTVWDATHNPMPNGTGLFGNRTSTQTALIIPIPEQSGQYYLFTTDALISGNGLNYSIIDMSLNGGLGDVTNAKNVSLLPTATEKLAAITHCNGQDIWVITHEWNSDAFYAYLVTSTIIHAPVITNIGPVQMGGVGNSAGYLKASPNGDQLALALAGTLSAFELYDFDRISGNISNYINLNVGTCTVEYGVAFSPDGTKLYGTCTGENELIQFDLLAGSGTDILNSATIVGSSTDDIRALQRGIDDKIYIAKVNQNNLARIEFPNALGLACTYTDNAVNLNGVNSRWGLPTIYVPNEAIDCGLLNISNCSNDKQAAIWYFGNNAGVDFNSGEAVALTDGQTNTAEGTASISDNDGNLLFYTDGIMVWDQTHTVMPNGTNLNGNPSSTQSGVIVPIPESNNRYYVFTVDFDGGPNGLQYSEVDMSLRGGLGDVTATKNVPLLGAPVTEKVTAVFHCNQKDIWVMAHDIGSNDFYVYLVTETGISTPVVSSVGAVHSTSIGEALGYMKASVDGKRVAAIKPGVLEVFDFDNTNGVLSNPITIINGDGNFQYGTAFSPDGTKLYASAGISSLVQFDLLAGSPTDIINSMTVVGTSGYGAIQLGIDGKLYIPSGEHLDRVNFPNNLGVACGFEADAVFLGGGGRFSRLGLPNFITSLFQNIPLEIEGTEQVCPSEDTHVYTVQRQGTCDAATYSFMLHGAATIVEQVDTAITLSFQNSEETDTLIAIRTTSCGMTTDTLFIQILPRPTFAWGAVDTVVCQESDAFIQFTTNVDSFRLTNTASGHVEVFNQPTKQFSQIEADSCYQLQLIDRTTLCERLVEFCITVTALSFEWVLTDTVVCFGETGEIQFNTNADSIRLTNQESNHSLLLTTNMATFAEHETDSSYVLELFQTNTICDTIIPFTVQVLGSRLDIGSDQIICQNQSVELDATIDNANTYSWMPTEGLSCADCATPTAQPNITTTYMVTAVDNDGCSFTDAITITVESCCPTAVPDFSTTTIHCSSEGSLLPQVPDTSTILSMIEEPDNAIITWSANPSIPVSYSGDNCTPQAFNYTLTVGCIHDPALALMGGSITLIIYPEIDASLNTIVGGGSCGVSLAVSCPNYIVSNDFDDNGATPNWENINGEGEITFTVTNPNAPEALDQSCLVETYMATYKCCIAEAGTLNVTDELCPLEDIVVSTNDAFGNPTHQLDADYAHQYLLLNANGEIIEIADATTNAVVFDVPPGAYDVCAFNYQLADAPQPLPVLGGLTSDIGSIDDYCYDLVCWDAPIIVPEDFVFSSQNISEGDNGGVTPFFYNTHDIHLTGGTPPYQYQWERTGYVRTRIQANTDLPEVSIQVIYADQATWSLSITDAHGCTTDVAGNALVFGNNGSNNTLLDIDDFEIKPYVNDGNRGRIDIWISGGDDSCGDYVCHWTGPHGFQSSEEDIEQLQAGWYTVVVSDCSGNQTQGWYWVPRQVQSGNGFIRGKQGQAVTSTLTCTPNPATATTLVGFQVPTTGLVKVSVYAMTGQLVDELFAGTAQQGEYYEVPFNAAKWASGVYLVHLKTASGEGKYEQLVITK